MKTRVLTAVALAPIVLGALLLSNPWPLLVLAAIVAFICGSEISRMLGRESLLAAFASAAVIAGVFLLPEGPPAAMASAGLFAIGVVAAWLSAKHSQPGLIPLGLFWAAGPLLAILALHATRDENLLHLKTPVLLAILPLWGGDTAAIFAGKAFGKRLLAPTISPKKTVEGAIANLLACILVAVGIAAAIGIPPLPGALCGVAAGTLGQAGDLFESYVKRKAGLKDSGTLLPGHGGVMDRIDSILFTAPAVALILAFVS